MPVAICWFRRDLRLSDNTALNAALRSGMPVLPIFIFDDNILQELPPDDARVNFIHNSLAAMEEELAAMNGTIWVYRGDPIATWEKILEEQEVGALFYNRDYEPYAVRRDEQVEQLLQSQSIPVHSFKDQVIFEPGEILKDDGLPYTVYTPFKNKWLKAFDPDRSRPAPAIGEGRYADLPLKLPTLQALGLEPSSIKVRGYDLSDLEAYADRRDLPALDATSHLGPHLRFGTVSIRQVVQTAHQRSSVFLSELIWREFFMQILAHFPHVVHRNFNPRYDGILWRNDIEDFKAWCEGRTGYPMVDAGMRQLNSTGTMHNRVRMVAASFLCKHLLIHWSWGEAYFARKLLDYELASNNGNWQWAAGTGCDAAPYFRVFNPEAQMKKFDPAREYIQKWLPDHGLTSYPPPIVDHKAARIRALETYKSGIAPRSG